MIRMGKKKSEQGGSEQPAGGKKSRPPSQASRFQVSIGKELAAAIDRYLALTTKEWEQPLSHTAVIQNAVRKFLVEHGCWPPQDPRNPAG